MERRYENDFLICLTTTKVDNQVRRSSPHPLDGLARRFIILSPSYPTNGEEL
jgi:hypothetical protein